MKSKIKKFFRLEWNSFDWIAAGSVFCGLFVVSWLLGFFFPVIWHFETSALENCTVSPSRYVSPFFVYSVLVFFSVSATGIPNRNRTKNLQMVVAVILMKWVLHSYEFFAELSSYSTLDLVGKTGILPIVRVFESPVISWFWALLMLVPVGVGAYAALDWKRRRILKGKVVLHYWWTDYDWPCLLTDYGCYVWVDEETGYKFSRYEEVDFDEEE